MSALSQPLRSRPLPAALQLPREVWLAWRSLRRRELGCFVLFGCVLGGLNLLTLAAPDVGAGAADAMLTETLVPIARALILLAMWLPADRSRADAPYRIQALAAATVLASVVSSLLVPLLLHAIDLPTATELAYRHKGAAAPGWLATAVADAAMMLIPAGLAVAVLEMAGRRRRAEQAMAKALGEHAMLTRAALESRLAAMQAQVEPRFLFDVLVDIERLYAAETAAGPGAGRGRAVAQMERLITYLRVALPKLRGSGSTLGVEIELVASYLDLVQAMHDGRPQFEARLPPELQHANFHPMLLLPLVQRAVRSATPVPRRIELSAQPVGKRIRVVLTITAPGGCRDDDELQRLQQRLRVLYDEQASLHCEETTAPAGGGGAGEPPLHVARFTLELPR